MTNAFDLTVFRAINGLAGRWVGLDAVFIFCAQYLIFVMVAVVFAYVAVSWKTSHFEGRTENLAHVFVGTVTAYLLNVIVGYLYFRPRPFVTLSHVVMLITKSAAEKSFPSGHATAAFAIAFCMLMHNRKWGRVLLIMAILVGFGRIAVGVHYPLDVIGGAVFGAIGAVIAAPVKKKLDPILDWIPVFGKR